MRFNWTFFLGAIAVLTISSFTILSGSPKFYAPYSLSVAIPAFVVSGNGLPVIFRYLLSALPVTLFYCIFVTRQIDSEYRIKKAGLFISITVVILSLLYSFGSYQHGADYQGVTHTLLMYIFNLVVIFIFSFAYWLNNRSPNLISVTTTCTIYFCWLGWIAFPWLGEGV